MSLQIILISLSLIIFYLIDLLRCKKKKCAKLCAECQEFLEKHRSKFNEKEFHEAQERLADIIARHDHKGAQNFKKELEKKKSFFEKGFLFLKGWAIPIILVFGVIKPMWFELMQIPTGSMRPTFKENDALSISKLQFGANIPMTTKHLLFDESEVKRMGIVTFTSENMPGDNTFKYFNLFPGYKQLTKRVVGIGGDTIYYYGGKIYGIDKNGIDISSDLQLESLKHIEHIPFISMQGRFEQKDNKTFNLKQSGQSIAQISYNPFGQSQTQMLSSSKNVGDIYNLWGIEGFAKFKIVKKSSIAKSIANSPDFLQNAEYYLELKHHPSIHKTKIDTTTYFYPIVHEESSYIPLNNEHLKALQNTLYTARFHVNKGVATRYDFERAQQSHPASLSGVPDGTYEFFYGQGYKIGPQGLSQKLNQEHPLMKLSKDNLFTLINLGIELDTRFSDSSSPFIAPSRYAYFRNGDLYAMGGKVFDQNDKTLKQFVAYEKRLAEIQPTRPAFCDPGAPLNEDGTLDIAKIKEFGFRVSEGNYLMLGDNHAMSGDSREFGLVPKENLRGAPSFIFWGPNERFGAPVGPAYRILTKPRVVVWSILSVALIITYIIRRKKKST